MNYQYKYKKEMKTTNKLLLFTLIAVLYIFTSCSNKGEYYEESGTVFHTHYRIKYQSSKLLTNKIDAELQQFNLSLNPFNPNSIIAKVNRNEEVEVDAWFSEVFNKSLEISQKTDGIFDITCAPLINLWGFGFSKMDSITPAMIDSVRNFVGYQKVKLIDNKIVKDDPRLLLNCSAIAKGYACDVIAQLMEREGIENYMIDIGGEIMMKGVNPGGQYWRIGISKAKDDQQGINKDTEDTIQLGKKGAIATSGNYRNFYIKDGKRYSHTIDPRTGYPAEQSILSATIVADNCMTADAYATAFMAMGVDAARKIAASLPEIEYFIIYADEEGKHQVEYSKGMLQYLPNRQAISVLENP